MKILISWVAYNNDLKDGRAVMDGPTFNYHRYFFNYDKHIILSSAKSDDTRAEVLVNALCLEFPDRSNLIEIQYTNIKDVIDINLIKTKVEELLIGLGDNQIDIFFSPGTSAMQVAWYICHTTLNLKTRLIQTRPSRFTSSGKPEFIEIATSFSTAPVTAIIRETIISKPQKKDGDFLISSSIKEVYDKALKIAQTDKVTTLIMGESGTGKEHLSRFIHHSSARITAPFIAVNCSAFNDHLLEARLFGYKKGAFTGADKDQLGLFEEANGGTIFLDEIGDISPYMQQSLLRVLQEQEILPLGRNKPVKIDVRIIAATNRNLVALCKQEKFRWDLYYRLTVTELFLPSLLQRGRSEVNDLTDYFIKSKKNLFRKSLAIELSKEAREALLSYTFPGNIRELENLIEQLYVFFDNKVTLQDLPDKIQYPDVEFSQKWVDVEKRHIVKVLSILKGNQNKACQLIGYKSINTLIKKIKDYNIDMNTFSGK